MRFSFLFSFLLLFTAAFSQWQVIPSGTTANLVDGCFVNDSVGFIISSGGVVLKTTNQGSAWQVNANLQGYFTSICNSGPDTLYAGGDCIFRSTDQGTSWNRMTSLSHAISDLVFFRSGDGFAVEPGYTICNWFQPVYIPDYKVNRSSDGGASWNYSFFLGDGGSFDIVNDHSAFITGGQNEIIAHCAGPWYNNSWKTTDRGGSWYPFSQPNYGHSIISFFTTDSGYYIRDANTIYKTSDGGNTLTGSYTELPDGGGRQCFFINDINGYLLGTQTIYLSTSNGFAWDDDYTSSDTLNYLFKNPSDFIFGIGSQGLIVKKHHVNSPYTDTVYRIKLNQPSVSFGYLAVDSSLSKNLTVKNTGNTGDSIEISVRDPYKISFGNGSFSDTLQSFLAVMQDTVVTIKFNPLLAKSYPDSLRITYGKGKTNLVPVSGNGFYGLYTNIAKDTIICTDTLRIGANIKVLDSVRMTICAGTQVVFLGSSSLTVNGTLEALGDSLHPVNVKSNDSGTYYPGFTISHSSPSDISIFRYCTMSTWISINSGMAIIDHCSITTGITVRPDYGKDARASITNNAISGSYWGISLSDCSDTRIENNDIYNNSRGITASTGHTVTVTGNRIHDNEEEAIYGFGNIVILDNKIFRNGGGIDWEGSSILIKNNEIWNNESWHTGGISCGVGSAAYIIQNLIYNNSVTFGDGAGIALAPDSYSYFPAYVVNNTVCNNRAGPGGKGNDFYATPNSSYGLSVLLYNNIFYNVSDTNNVAWNLNLKKIVEYNCIHQAGADTIGQYTVTAYPGFVLPTISNGTMSDLGSYSWKLTGNSPCVNAGGMDLTTLLTDPDFCGSPRIVQERVDIGAYEYPFPFSVDGKDADFQYSVFPNPADDLLHVIVNNTVPCTFSLYDLTSRKILEEKVFLSTSLNIRNLCPGIYFYMFRNDKGSIYEGKVIKK